MRILGKTKRRPYQVTHAYFLIPKHDEYIPDTIYHALNRDCFENTMPQIRDIIPTEINGDTKHTEKY